MDVVIHVGCFIGGVGEVGFLGVPEVGGHVVTEVTELEGNYFPHDDYEKMRDWQKKCKVVDELENGGFLQGSGEVGKSGSLS